LSSLQTKNSELNKITKNEIISIMFSVFLVLDEYKIKKDLLMDAFMKCYEKSQPKIPFLVRGTTTTSQATPAATSATSTSPAARGWDKDNALVDVGAAWDPNNPLGNIDTCL
jgi:hypothetical protein